MSTGSGLGQTVDVAIFNTTALPWDDTNSTTQLSLGFLSGVANYVGTGQQLGAIQFFGQGSNAGYGGAAMQAIVMSGGNVSRNAHVVDLAFSTKPSGSAGQAERMRINGAGAIKFNAYDGTNNTGSPTHILGTDASGNVVKSTAGSSIGPWLPLAAGSGDPLTGTLYGTDVIMSSGMILGNAIQNATVNLQIGEGRTGNGFSFIDLIGDATYTDYGFRMLRGNTGPNALSILEHRGTGAFEIKAAEAADIVFETTATERMRILSSGTIKMTDENGGVPLLQARNFATSATGAFNNGYAMEFRGATTTGSGNGMMLLHMNEAVIMQGQR